MRVAVKVLLPRLNEPVATKCRAGVAATIDIGTCVTKSEKVLNTVTVVVSTAVRPPMSNWGRKNAGRPGGGGAARGASCGLAAGVFKSTLSDPMRITPAL